MNCKTMTKINNIITINCLLYLAVYISNLCYCSEDTNSYEDDSLILIKNIAIKTGSNYSLDNEKKQLNGAIKRSNDYSTTAPSVKIQKCSKQSIILARQALVHEFENNINNYNSIWFNDLDRDELLEEQRHSLASIIMSGSSPQLLNTDGQPVFDIEASYFRPTYFNDPLRSNYRPNNSQGLTQLPISIKLMRGYMNKCQLNSEKNKFTFVFGLTIGPFEHNLDVVYHFPKELKLSQPIDWRYAQIKLVIPKMNYEINLKQNSNYHLLNSNSCPIEIADVTYLSDHSLKNQISVFTNGLGSTNQTILNLGRLFNDYTRPSVSNRMRNMLKFYLNTKTLPLSTSG